MNIKELKQKHNLSQTQLAKIAGVSQRSISAYENGQSEPTESTLIKLANYFHLTLDELVGHEVPYLINKSLLSNEQLELINLIKDMNYEECRILLAYAEGVKKGIQERDAKFNR